MKKLFLIAIVLFSCETESTNLGLKTESLRKDLIKMQPSELREAFNSLTPEQQRDVWRDRLISESDFYTGEKKEYLQLIAKLQRISPNFDPQNAKTKCIELFGDEAKRILTTLYLPNEKQYLNARLMVPDPNEKCDCSLISDWCDFQLNSGQPNEDWECKSLGCQPNGAFGCGTMFLYRCEGQCDLVDFD